MTLAFICNDFINYFIAVQTNLEPVIEVRNVWKSFKTVQAVKGINIRINSGEFVALLGPNGAGKTTLVEIIEGIQRPDKGDIFILGKKWNENEAVFRRIIGLSLQETYFIDKLTVKETLNLFASFFRLGRSRVDEIIGMTGLEDKRKSYVVHLSGGQRQRLALGIALLNRPKVLLLDEPTTGLDPNARHEVWEILKQLKNQSGTSLILTTHYMEEAEKLCDYIIIMDHGQVLREGTLSQLLDDGSAEKTIEFSFEKPLTPDIKIDTLLRFKLDERREKGMIDFETIDAELPEFFRVLKENNVRLSNIECRRKTLDDLFISLTGRHLNE